MGLDKPEPELVDPVVPAGDLAAEIAAFTDLRECAGRHRLQDPLVADGIDAIGYDTLVFDACRAIKALKDNDPGSCDATAATRIRERCHAQVAMLTGKEALCPTDDLVPGFPMHDVQCVAVARRDVRPCAALEGTERAMCEGLVARDASRCGTDPRCNRMIARWRSSLPPISGKSPYASSLRVEVTSLDEHADGGTQAESFDLSREASAGAVVVHLKNETRVLIGDAREIPAHGDTRGGLALVLPAAGAAARAAPPKVVVRWSNGVVSTVTTGTIPRVSIETIGTEPNQPVRLTIEATVGATTSPKKTRWTIDTWVRDIVAAK